MTQGFRSPSEQTDRRRSGVSGDAEGTMSEREKLMLDLLRLRERMMRRAKADFSRRLERFGVTIPQYFALVEIDQLGPRVTMGQVAEATQFPASSMTSITDRLVERGLVERGAHPTDRRAVVASITPAGQDLLRQVEDARRRDAIESLSGISDEDLSHFLRTFQAIDEQAEQAARDGAPGHGG